MSTLRLNVQSGLLPLAGARARRAECRAAATQRARRSVRNVTVNAAAQEGVSGKTVSALPAAASTVQNVTAQMAGKMMEDGWVLLDVRPEEEVEKVAIEGAVTVPLFVMDDSVSVGSLLKQMSAFGMGGWWIGGGHMVANEGFMGQVQAKIPKDSRVVVGCQKGLRSLTACEQLIRAGYSDVAWVMGGFDTAVKGDLPTVGGKDIRYAGIGGLSELLGWTEVQQQDAKKGEKTEAIPLTTVTKIGIVILILDGLLFAFEQLTGWGLE